MKYFKKIFFVTVKLLYSQASVARKMNFKTIFCINCLFLLVIQCMNVVCQEAAFELPVQLVGFPFIILSVRLTNFLKKLSYSLQPTTYRARARRELTWSPTGEDAIDAIEAEKYIVGEFGARACIYERICADYAAKAGNEPQVGLDWTDVFKQYKRSPDQKKEFYLLSVFLGDIVGSPQLCHQLGKRRSCEAISSEEGKLNR